MRRIKYSKLLALIIFIYIVSQLVGSLISKNISTLVLENEKFQAKISTKGLIIRDEYVIKSSVSGKVELLAKDGERVKRSQNVANVYKKNIDSSINKEIEALNKEIDDIKKGENNISKNDIDKLNKEINNISKKVQTNLLESTYENIDSYQEDLSKLINQRNRLLNNQVDTKKLETKEYQKEILSNKKEDGIINLSTNISGIVSYKYDSNEEKYSYDKLGEITKKDIYDTDNKYKEVNKDGDEIKENSPILRVINNYNNYIAICISKEESKNFELGKSVKISYNNQQMDSKVEKMHKDGDNVIIIFKISNQNIGIYDTRVEEFDIIYMQMEGLKIPRSSIETVNKEHGVYVVDEESSTAKFVALKGIIYEDDDFVFVDYYSNDINGVKTVNLYDKIILKPNSINKNMRIE